MEVYKFKIHSLVDVITNSSTVIYTYQSDTTAARDLVQAILDLHGITDKTPDDLFWYYSKCDDDVYLEYLDEYDDSDFNKYCEENGIDFENMPNKEDWLNSIFEKIYKGEMDEPSWITAAEEDQYDDYNPDMWLHIVPKDESYKALSEKLLGFLNSVDNDGGYDG